MGAGGTSGVHCIGPGVDGRPSGDGLRSSATRASAALSNRGLDQYGAQVASAARSFERLCCPDKWYVVSSKERLVTCFLRPSHLPSAHYWAVRSKARVTDYFLTSDQQLLFDTCPNSRSRPSAHRAIRSKARGAQSAWRAKAAAPNVFRREKTDKAAPRGS